MSPTEDWDDFGSKPPPKSGLPDPHRSGHWFSLLVGLLVVGWFVGVGWFGHVFGGNRALLLGLIPAVPIWVAIRLRGRWPTVLARELVMVAVLGIVAVGGAVCVVQNWYEHGFDDDHAEDMCYAHLESLMHRDSAFRQVRLLPRVKGVRGLAGKVASRADLDRLATLAQRCGIEVGDRDRPFRDQIDLPGEPSSSSRSD